MIDQLANGYVVVTRPSDRRYRGVDREPWELVDTRYYSGTLPADLRELYGRIRNGNNRGLWWPTATSLTDAQRLLAFTREEQASAELIAVHSPYLARELGRIDLPVQAAGLLGIDVVSIGEWSLLAAFHDGESGLPGDLGPLVNENGLLRQEATVRQVEATYRELAGTGRVEPIADPDSGISVEPVRVYLIDPSASA